MSEYKLYEFFGNLESVAGKLKKAAMPESEGGEAIVLSELLSIFAQAGIEVINDIQDVEPE